jgi:8-oxo-dGTP pyrophosphatase MutT (NUDIX family)
MIRTECPVNNDDDYDNDASHAEALARTGYWGEMAAGMIFLAKDTGRIGIGKRSEYVLEPGTYGTMGGAGNPGESPEQVAIREGCKEEAGYAGKIEMIPLAVFEHHSGFKYFNFLGVVEKEFEPTLNWENSSFSWVDGLDSLPTPLHPGMHFLIANSRHSIDAEISKCREAPPSPAARAMQAMETINHAETVLKSTQDKKP